MPLLAGKVTETVGAVVSTVTVPLLALSVPIQFVGQVGVSVYCHFPSGTLDSVQVMVPVPEQEAVTVTAEPPAAGYRLRVYCEAGMATLPLLVEAWAKLSETVLPSDTS